VLGDQAARESDLRSLRRALVTLAVAGSGDDRDAFAAEAEALCATARRLGIDPEPLFDAAAALVAEPDVTAREALVLAPRSRLPHSPGWLGGSAGTSPE
jgi:hypothetical protein